MDRVTFSKGDCKEQTTSAWLAAVITFAFNIEFFNPFKAFTIKMKEVQYSVYQKLLTIIVSIIMGCESTKDINEKLSGEKLSAHMLEMERFPDQSQINILLNRMDDNAVIQLRDIHQNLFMKHSLSIDSTDDVVVDLDQSGLIANGKSYELADKGYFAKKKNQCGYQLSAAFAGKHQETIGLFLDSGNNHCQERLDDLLKSTTSKFKDHLKSGKLIIRADSGYGASNNIEKLNKIPGLKFVVKGYSTVRAKNLASDIPYEDYIQADKSAWVYELQSEGCLRIILVQILQKNGALTYSMLITNIGSKRMSAVELFHFYNDRQTIEAFFKAAKNVYSIKNLRTRKFYGIYAFLWLVFIAHNLVIWFRTIMLKDTEIQDVGIKTLIKQVGTIRAFVEKTSEGFNVIIQPISRLAKILAESLPRPKYVQLCFQLQPY